MFPQLDLAAQGIKLALALALATALFGAGYYVADNRAAAKIASLEKTYAENNAAAERLAADAQRAEQRLQNTRTLALAKIADAERVRSQELAARNAGLERRARLVRDQFARIAQALGEGSEPAASDGSSTAAGPGLVLADVYRSTDEAAVELARAFDGARSAGLACERAYEVVSDSSATTSTRAPRQAVP